jgi:prepilin-type N-terminal cleavage/methylation domain-containing protein
MMRVFCNKEGGFTLVEVLIAMSILAIGILGITGLAGNAIRSSGYSQAITQANNLESSDSTTSRTDLRRTCTQTVTTISRPVYSCTPTTIAITLNNQDFNWSYTVTHIDLDGNGTAAPGIDGLKRLDVTISWVDTLWQSTRSITVVTLRNAG